MTPPTGYVQAEWVGGGVVKLPERSTSAGVLLAAVVCGPGDFAYIPEGEAQESDNWHVVVEVGTPVTRKKGSD